VVEWLVQVLLLHLALLLEHVDVEMMQVPQEWLTLVQVQWQVVVPLVQQAGMLLITLQLAKSILIHNSIL
jgi:hypothetical protein